ncbi:hypothetical protein GCM10010468_14220 [Actinocorallia longicatena]|uniref:Uncharacterized protein n=1 Tax=Actinocorallia longicatena TaxID=111803 RepID=A0ABP6Q2U0_9ACTN
MIGVVLPAGGPEGLREVFAPALDGPHHRGTTRPLSHLSALRSTYRGTAADEPGGYQKRYDTCNSGILIHCGSRTSGRP